jgi:hypothetical protein
MKNLNIYFKTIVGNILGAHPKVHSVRSIDHHILHGARVYLGRELGDLKDVEVPVRVINNKNGAHLSNDPKNASVWNMILGSAIPTHNIKFTYDGIHPRLMDSIYFRELVPIKEEDYL